MNAPFVVVKNVVHERRFLVCLRPLPGAANDQQLLLEQQVLSDNALQPARAKKPKDARQ